MRQFHKYQMKPAFEERMKNLLPDEKDFQKFSEIIHIDAKNFVRCNTIKISPDELLKKLKRKWEVKQPFSNHPEIFLI